MSLLDYLTPVKTGKKILEIQVALLGRHVYTNHLNDLEKEKVRDFVDEGLETGGVEKTMDDLHERVRWLLVGLTLKKTGLDKGFLKDFKLYVKDPFAIEGYSGGLVETAAKLVRKKHGIETTF